MRALCVQDDGTFLQGTLVPGHKVGTGVLLGVEILMPEAAMTRPGRDHSCAETPYPLTNAAGRPPRRPKAGHIEPLRVQQAGRLGRVA